MKEPFHALFLFDEKIVAYVEERQPKKYIYSGKRLYQYNEDDPFDFNFNLYQAVTAFNLKSFFEKRLLTIKT